MCRPVTCRNCGGKTWTGCGLHVDEVMKAVPRRRRCRCPQDRDEQREDSRPVLQPRGLNR